MKKITGILLGMFLLMTVSEAAPEKKIYAHYMGCWPAGTHSLPWAMGNMHKTLNHRSPKNYTDATGGRIVDWPLLPQGMGFTPEQNAELEIKRAVRAGIDGFAIDAWAGGNLAKEMVGHLIAAAERMKIPFEVTICLDPACQPGNKENLDNFEDTIRVLLKYKNSPHLARRNGKILIFGYSSHGILPRSERRMKEGPERWKKIADAYRELRKRIGEPLYFHFSMDGMRYKNNKKQFLEYAEWLGKNFDAVGGFIGTDWAVDPDVAESVRKGGAEWCQPMTAQYVSRGGQIHIKNGLDMLRERWISAIENGSTVIQYVTWNDYGETTNLMPGYSSNYTLTAVNRYYADWWKSGRKPEIRKDEIHLVFLRQTPGSRAYPFSGRIPTSGILEVVTMLTKPGIVELPEYGAKYEASAGMSYKQFPLRTGKVSAKLKRGLFKSTVLEVTAPEEVTDKPWREDLALVAFGSNFMDEWKSDFGNVPPLLYSENGDIDGDGLPNWFEMYYFGKFPLMNTATCANPQDDPDKDGFTNLQEYLNRTDPKRAELPAYKPGFVWSLNDLFPARWLFNPQRDSHDNEVWFRFFRYGEKGGQPHDGKYELCTIGAPWRKHVVSDISGNPNFKYGADTRFLKRNGKNTVQIGGRAYLVMPFSWRSPVDGTVSVKAVAEAAKGAGVLTVKLMKNDGELRRKEIRSEESAGLKADEIPVKKGDFIHFIADYSRSYIHCYLNQFDVELEPVGKGRNP